MVLAGNQSAPAKLMDLEMMLLLNSGERTEKDFRRLFSASGWKLARIIPTQSAMFIIQGEPA